MPAFIRGKNKIARNENGNKLYGFSYSKNIANIEAFRWVISSSIDLLFLKSDTIPSTLQINGHKALTLELEVVV